MPGIQSTRPSSPTPSHAQFKRIVKDGLNSDKEVLPGDTYYIPSDTPGYVRDFICDEVLRRGATKALETGKKNTKYLYESFSDFPHAQKGLKEGQTMLGKKPEGRFQSLDERGYDLDLNIKVPGSQRPVEMYSRTRAAVNHRDGVQRSFVTEATFRPRAGLMRRLMRSLFSKKA